VTGDDPRISEALRDAALALIRDVQLTMGGPSNFKREPGRSEPKPLNGGSVSLVVSPTLLGRPLSWVSV
jgi:hypothetical protein